MSNPISRPQALSCGETPRTLRGSKWSRQHRGIYVASGAEQASTPYESALAAVGHRAALSHFSAAAMWKLPLPCGSRGDRPVHVTVYVTPRPRHRPGIRVHKHLLDSGDVREVDGLRVTSVSRTWFDLASVCAYDDHVAITDEILHRKLCTAEQLTQSIKSGRRGVKKARWSLILADERAESPWETLSRLTLRAAGIMVVPQVEVRNVLGDVIARVDLALEEFKVGVEYDGEHHLDLGQQRRDMDRVRALERAGWLILRFGVEDVRDHPQRMIAEVRAAIRSRRDQPPCRG